MLEKLNITTALDYASGADDRNGATIDMQGHAGVIGVVKFAAIAADAVTSIKWQQGSALDASGNLSDGADLAGTAIAVAADDDNQLFITELDAPKERYVRLVVDKDATHATAEDATYTRYGPGFKPTVNAATDAVTVESHHQPAEGTA